MKKRLLAFALILAMTAAMLAACTSDEGKDTAEKASGETKEETLPEMTFYIGHVISMRRSTMSWRSFAWWVHAAL